MFDEFDEDDLFSDSRQPQLYTPPRATTDYIQLRFQLARLQVYRIVRLPVTFTFANLHTLIQYMFGWSNAHLHKAEVFSNVVLHDDDDDDGALTGTIKSCGRRRPLEDTELSDPRAVAHWKRFEPADKPIYRVQPRVEPSRRDLDGTMTMEDKGVTLESIWAHDIRRNVSDGQCENAQIGVVYTYDFGDEWTVHITCEQGSVFHQLDTPSHLPVFKHAQGAPPIEHAEDDWVVEDEPEEKKVSARLFDVSYFDRYCQSQVTSEARKKKLEILTLEEAEVRRRDFQQREKEKLERMAEDEYDEDEEEYDSEYYEESEDVEME